jgi:hypothetical protein
MKNAVVLLVAMFLAACSSAGDIRITSRPIEIDIARTADPNGVQMLPVNFRVVTRETLSSFMEELSRTQGGAPVFIAMTARDYENMSLNLSDLRRYIEQQQAVIVYYRQMTARLPSSNQ